MKRCLLALVGLIAVVGAVNLDGRLGMGVGMSPDAYLESAALGLPVAVIDIAVTKIGMNPKMSLEPIFQFTLQSANDITSTYFDLSVLADLLMKGHSKTNVYAKIGLGFQMLSPGGGADSEFGFNLPFGFGLEHFISEHCSINLSALSGFTFLNYAPGGGDSYFNIKLGNEKPFALYVLWYY